MCCTSFRSLWRWSASSHISIRRHKSRSSCDSSIERIADTRDVKRKFRPRGRSQWRAHIFHAHNYDRIEDFETKSIASNVLWCQFRIAIRIDKNQRPNDCIAVRSAVWEHCYCGRRVCTRFSLLVFPLRWAPFTSAITLSANIGSHSIIKWWRDAMPDETTHLKAQKRRIFDAFWGTRCAHGHRIRIWMANFRMRREKM